MAGAQDVLASTPPPADEEELVHAGEIIAGKYRIDRRIARGGMGSVWAGWDTALDRAVAVKFMDPSIASSKPLRERFQREARAAAGLRTPFVVQIFEHGMHGRMPFIAMELLEGEDLHDRLQRDKRLAPQTLARILNQIARALRRAHDKGIIHRDLKPRNIFLARDEDEETVKILDFGIAKNIGQEVDGDTTKTGQVLGSLNYMSPEQARGAKEIDHRADLWSLAVILFRALTGRTLFSGRSSGDVIVRICTDPIPKVTEVAPDLPEELNAFFARALDRNPENRYPSAIELAVAFMDIARAARPATATASVDPVGTASLAPSGEWTPRSDLGTPFSDSQSYPSVDVGPSGAPGGAPEPASGAGLASSPSVPSVPSLPSGSQEVPASPFDNTVAAGDGLASSLRRRRIAVGTVLAVAGAVLGGAAVWSRLASTPGEPVSGLPSTTDTATPSVPPPGDTTSGATETAASTAAVPTGEPTGEPSEPAPTSSPTKTTRTPQRSSSATHPPRNSAAATASPSVKPKERWGY